MIRKIWSHKTVIKTLREFKKFKPKHAKAIKDRIQSFVSVPDLNSVHGVIQVLEDPDFFKVIIDDAELQDLGPTESYEVLVCVTNTILAVTLLEFEQDSDPFRLS